MMRIKILRHKPDSILFYVNYTSSYHNANRMNKIVFIGMTFCEPDLVLYVQRSEFLCNEWFDSSRGHKIIFEEFSIPFEEWEVEE